MSRIESDRGRKGMKWQHMAGTTQEQPITVREGEDENRANL